MPEHAATASSARYSIVFVHIGSSLPTYLTHAIRQARRFNECCPIVVLANQDAVDGAALPAELRIAFVAIESLPKSSQHRRWIENLDQDQSDYWLNTRRRFLLLYDLMLYSEHDTNVCQLETDNMLYRDLREIIPTFCGRYDGIASTFNNDWRCIPGIMFIRHAGAMEVLADCFADHAGVKIDDMKIIARCARQNGPAVIDHLPIIMPQYLEDHSPSAELGPLVSDVGVYSKNIDAFASVFDGSALGQFLDGTNWGQPPGFITRECVINPSRLKIMWKLDGAGRRIPFVAYDRHEFVVNNLHIQSKRLDRFLS